MFEKVNPKHPDKVADRIAGAIVDLAYKQEENPKIAVEVLLGHGKCFVIAETSAKLDELAVFYIVQRIAGKNIVTHYTEVKQDNILAKNQDKKFRCGDNGIFKGVPVTEEQKELTRIAHEIYDVVDSDGKYILDCSNRKLVICQSNVSTPKMQELLDISHNNLIINPLGDWTGGIDVDSGATNRKLGSDMGDAVTGGGLHGKDLSKADVSVNIYAHIRAQQLGKPVELSCAIGDEVIDGLPYSAIIEVARDYIFDKCGGFEKFAEWGLIR